MAMQSKCALFLIRKVWECVTELDV